MSRRVPQLPSGMKTITDPADLGWRYRCNGQAGHRMDPTVNTFMERQDEENWFIYNNFNYLLMVDRNTDHRNVNIRKTSFIHRLERSDLAARWKISARVFGQIWIGPHFNRMWNRGASIPTVCERSWQDLEENFEDVQFVTSTRRATIGEMDIRKMF
ncbi:hypothetical protein FQA39_LY08332 [Lamprigera yunnana]|nr:hypothetical protein FQA39_LY08332 [Lamprigera yunnana]